ncbi:uncharacterized protein LOC131930870 [Physella acuta]|uniref:uncharacterized protein LOC131930870 n=1 Tax=Physella acuta TaxID=109671 RepID=UPI0027DCFC1B|nr:uncharacterized protein LOC131930870 [Physella acuta]
MVSIPEWARIAPLAEIKPQDNHKLLNKFYKQKEAEVIKQAEESGFFLNPTENVLVSYCSEQNSDEKDIRKFRIVCLNGLHLRTLGDIQACNNLTICLLANNYLTKFDSLVTCTQLIKLDLHSNQLNAIPGPNFWGRLLKLHTLYLHDNPIGKFETLQILSSSPCLSILTLYDTPLSLKKNYRHHVVNSILTLKALDKHVISDEEIIEDAVFSSRFKMLSPPFRINVSHQSSHKTTYSQEMALFHSVNAKVNSILAKHSPVLIVQRVVRGFLIRKKRLAIRNKPKGVRPREVIPPPGTPVFLIDSVRTTLAGEAVDYDTYMRNRRPGSIVPVEALTQLVSLPSLCEDGNFQINMTKLEHGTMSNLLADSSAMETMMAEHGDMGLNYSHRKEKKMKREKDKEEKQKKTRIKDVKQFFGPILSTEPDEDDEEMEVSRTGFRLRGEKPKLYVGDATTEMILSKKEAGQMVREAETNRLTKELFKPKPKADPYTFTNNEQRFFNRAQGTMGFSNLLAVHKAYKEREKSERAAARMENILGLREERLRAKDRISMYHDQRRAQILKARELEKSQLLELLEKKELQRLNFMDKQQERKVRSSDINKLFRANHSFMLDFNSQHTSVSKALLRHDRQAKWEDTRTHRRNKVTTAKMNEIEQRDAVKNFMEYRLLMRQTETAVAKAALDTKMLTEANERIMDARNRVAHQKACQASIQAYYPIPPNTVPLASTAPAGISEWNESFPMRVGRHHTVYS